jgi:hypothetical protein
MPIRGSKSIPTPGAIFQGHLEQGRSSHEQTDKYPLATSNGPPCHFDRTPATATITYDPTYSTVSSVIDANSNVTRFESVNSSGSPSWASNYEQVTVSGGSMPDYTYTISFASTMAQETQTNGSGNEIDTKVYGDSNNPFSPTTVTDGNDHMDMYIHAERLRRRRQRDNSAIGNTTYFGTTAGTYGYNIANQNVLVTYPATGETGSGNGYNTVTVACPGGRNFYTDV